MKLFIKERFAILDILPKQFDYVTYNIKNELLARLSLTEEELHSLGIHIGGETYMDKDRKEFTVTPGTIDIPENVMKDYYIDVLFSSVERNLIKRELTNLENKRALTEDTVGIYKRFIEDKEE